VATYVVRARGDFAGTHQPAPAGRVQNRRRVFWAEATLVWLSVFASATLLQAQPNATRCILSRRRVSPYRKEE
jgi:hypothetical protein